MIVFHTSAGGTAIVVEALTRFMRSAPPAPVGAETVSATAGEARSDPSARPQRFGFLPFAQGALDGRGEGVQLDPEQLRGVVLGGQEVTLQSLHQRPDQIGVLAGDGGGDACRQRSRTDG